MENIKVQPVYGMLNLRVERELATSSYEYILKDIKDLKNNYIRFGFHLWECQSMKYYEDFGYDNFYDFVDANFHMDKSAVSRCINVFLKFSRRTENDLPQMFVDDSYSKYSYSQLCEMLPMDEKQIKQIKPEMTIAAIREKKKEWRNDKMSVAISQQKIGYRNNGFCDKEPEVLCNIENVMKKHFIKGGNIIGCAGCCAVCMNVEKCVHACGTAIRSIKNRIGQLRYEQENVEVVEDIEYLELEPTDKCEQKLPILKNDNERKDFIAQYPQWNIWIDIPQTGERYWKYQLANGVGLVVKATLRFEYMGYKQGYAKERSFGSEEYYIFEGDKTATEAKTNRSMMIQYLKEYQK